MKTVPLGQITCNLDSKRIPLNGSERAKRSQTKLYPYIGANNVVDYIDDYIFDEKILCVAEDGGSWGKNQICAKIYNEKCWVNNHAHVLIAKTDVILEYLASYLNYANLNPYITGTTRGKLTRKQLDSVEIPLPPIVDQKRIAYLLGKVEGLIAQRKQHLQHLDDLLKSIFLEMFGDPVRNPKNHKISVLAPYITHLTSGGRGWAKYYAPLGKRFIRSLDVQMNNIGSDDVVYVNPPGNKEAERTRVKPDDVLLTITGSKIGRVCYVPKDFEEAYISQHVAIIRTRNISPIYLSFYLSMPNCGQRTIEKQQYGQAKPGLNLTQIENFEILDPDINLQNHFATIVEKVEGWLTDKSWFLMAE